ncbi:MAG: M23 family metallopeptidase [Candidatus Bipolaricaulia bacterium]
MDRLVIVVGTLVVSVATLVTVLTFPSPLAGLTSATPSSDVMSEPLEPLPPIELTDQSQGETATETPPTDPSPTPELPRLPPANDDRIQLLTDGRSRLGWSFARTDGWRAGTHDGHDGDDAHAIDWNHGQRNDDVGETVLSVASGRVIYARSGRGRVANPDSFNYGNTVVVQLSADPSFAVRYAHLRRVHVTEGDTVLLGEPIGTVGATGLSGRLPYTAHLHLVLYQRLDERPDPSDGCYSGKTAKRGIDWLRSGQTPCQLNQGETKFAARFRLDPSIRH